MRAVAATPVGAHELRFRQRWHDAVKQAAVLAVVATVAWALAWWLHLGDGALVLRIYLVALAVIALGLVTAAFVWRAEDRTARGTLLDQLARPAPAAVAGIPAGLKQADATVVLAMRSAAGRDRWLRGEARTIVETRLALVDADGRHPPTADVDAQLVAHAARVGAETWALIRPDRPADDSRAPGLAPDALARVLADLEQL